jgi:hypothetical protein
MGTRWKCDPTKNWKRGNTIIYIIVFPHFHIAHYIETLKESIMNKWERTFKWQTQMTSNVLPLVILGSSSLVSPFTSCLAFASTVIL